MHAMALNLAVGAFFVFLVGMSYWLVLAAPWASYSLLVGFIRGVLPKPFLSGCHLLIFLFSGDVVGSSSPVYRVATIFLFLLPCLVYQVALHQFGANILGGQGGNAPLSKHG